MSSSAAKRIAEVDLTEGQKRALENEAPLDPELLAAIAESEAQIARGETFSSEQVLAEMRAILYA